MKRKNLLYVVFLSTLLICLGNYCALATDLLVEEIFIDSPTATKVTGTMNLQKNVTYLLIIEGTHSLWATSEWTDNVDNWQGIPENEPIFFEGVPLNNYVGADTAFRFSCPESTYCNKDKLPISTAFFNFSMDNESSWNKTISEVYSLKHIYTFNIVGEGYPIILKCIDSSYPDNYGKYKLSIVKKQCNLLDTDNDGVVDEIDECSNTPLNSYVDSKGCTADGIFISSQQASQIVNCMKSIQVILDSIGIEDAIRALEISAGVRNK